MAIKIKFGEDGVATLRDPNRAERIAGVNLKYKLEAFMALNDQGKVEEANESRLEAETHLIAMTTELLWQGKTYEGESARTKASELALYYDEGVVFLVDCTFRKFGSIVGSNGDLRSGSDSVRQGAEGEAEPAPEVPV